MNLKKIKVIAIFGIFITSFIVHFLYDLFPNLLSSILFPVNESIWEHMKMLFTSIMLYSIIDYFLLIKNNINFNNFRFNLVFSSLISIPIYLILYLPLYKLIGENLVISIILMFIVYIIVEIISYFILKAKEYRFVNDLSIPLIIICYLIFAYLTYEPPKSFLFFDSSEGKYGINNCD